MHVEVAGPLGTPRGLAQRKRASPRGEALARVLPYLDIRFTVSCATSWGGQEPIELREGVTVDVPREPCIGIDRAPWLGGGEGNGNPLQCSCLENPRNRGACWVAVYGVTQSWTRLKRLSSSSDVFNTSMFLAPILSAGIEN